MHVRLLNMAPYTSYNNDDDKQDELLRRRHQIKISDIIDTIIIYVDAKQIRKNYYQSRNSWKYTRKQCSLLYYTIE